MRSPWNGGLMRRRSRWWRSPSRSRIECAPRIGPRMGATASPERRSSPSAVKWAWEWRWPRRRACSSFPPLRSARHETVHDDLAVQWEYLLVRVVTLTREGVDHGAIRLAPVSHASTAAAGRAQAADPSGLP